MHKRVWFVVRKGYIVGKFRTLEEAESFLQEKGWKEDRDDASIVRYDR